MVNCNPETVSTDYDTSDRLYFEPLTVEDVLEICAAEQPEAVVVQLGGQTPLNLARRLEKNGAPIAGTSPDRIDEAEDRERFSALCRELGVAQPPPRRGRRPGGGRGGGGPHRAARAGAALLRAGRAGHEGGVFPRRSGRIHGGAAPGRPAVRPGRAVRPGADRPVPGIGGGSGRGRRLRRAGAAGRGDHGARGGGGGALRRFGLLHPARSPLGEVRPAHHRRQHRAPWPPSLGVQGADEHPVRGEGR